LFTKQLSVSLTNEFKLLFITVDISNVNRDLSVYKQILRLAICLASA